MRGTIYGGPLDIIDVMALEITWKILSTDEMYA